MIEFVPYEPWHLMVIDLQPTQTAYYQRFVQPGYAESLAKGVAWTGFINDRAVGCAGFAPQWEGRAVAWALFGRGIPKTVWPAIVRKVRAETQGIKGRIEATVPFGFGAGCRLAKLLGFEIEGLMKAFGPDGSDHFLYARVT